MNRAMLAADRDAGRHIAGRDGWESTTTPQGRDPTLAKGDKPGLSPGPAELLVVEAEQFPNAVIVELWHRGPNGKREFLDSRRYEAVEMADETDEEVGELVPTG